jgi:hypothetical protein
MGLALILTSWPSPTAGCVKRVAAAMPSRIPLIETLPVLLGTAAAAVSMASRA